MRRLVIGGREITDQSPAYLIAELGHNHGGSIDTCLEMVRAAAGAGASAVKLQKRDNRSLYTEAYYSRSYQSENSYGATYGEHREALELGLRDYVDAIKEARRHEVDCFATPFDQQSARFLMKLGVPAFKIASSDVTNTELLKHVAEYGMPMLISTGAASQEDVDRAVNLVYPINERLAILQCTAAYPAKLGLLNLNVIKTYRERYPEITIGYSSHYSGISDVVAAYVLGARVIEKHFTLDRTSKGSDHAFSLEPQGFAKMHSYLEKTREMLGSGVKIIQDEEQGMIEKMRMSTRWWQEMNREAGGVNPYCSNSQTWAQCPRDLAHVHVGGAA